MGFLELEQHAQAVFAASHERREAALRDCRRIIRDCANAIRAVHRGEMPRAHELLDQACRLHADMRRDLDGHPDIYFAGYVHDAQKEIAEAAVFAAIVERRDVPGPADLDVELASYLNGLGDVMGELRRFLLDGLRGNDGRDGERLLQIMDDIYSVLVSIDFPDAMTGGLRRTTDAARGILEKTRGDWTMGVLQRKAALLLEDQAHRLGGTPLPSPPLGGEGRGGGLGDTAAGAASPPSFHAKDGEAPPHH